MAKKQTRRSISVSRTTYEKLKAFCEASGVSMSQFVETRVGDFLGSGEAVEIAAPPTKPVAPPPAPRPVPMTAMAARFAVEPPPPIIKSKSVANAPSPTPKSADQIFTF